MIYLIMTVFLQILFSNLNILYFSFFPFFILISIFFLYFIIDHRILIVYIICSGLVYDILYSNIFLLNTICFVLIVFLFDFYYKKRKVSFKNFNYISLLLFILYLFIILLFNRSFNIYRIKYVFIINVIFYIISLIVLNRRIFSRKIKINYSS